VSRTSANQTGCHPAIEASSSCRNGCVTRIFRRACPDPVVPGNSPAHNKSFPPAGRRLTMSGMVQLLFVPGEFFCQGRSARAGTNAPTVGRPAARFLHEARAEKRVSLLGHHEIVSTFSFSLCGSSTRVKLKSKIRHRRAVRVQSPALFCSRHIPTSRPSMRPPQRSQMFHGLFHEREPFVEREQRLFAMVFCNGHNDGSNNLTAR